MTTSGSLAEAFVTCNGKQAPAEVKSTLLTIVKEDPKATVTPKSTPNAVLDAILSKKDSGFVLSKYFELIRSRLNLFQLRQYSASHQVL